MKTLRTLARLAIVFSLATAIASCDLLMSLLDPGAEESITIEERVVAFGHDLDKPDRSMIAETHFHPEMQSYSQLADATVLTTGPLSHENAPFTFGEPVIDSSGRDSTATVPFENAFTEGTIVFTMRPDGEDNYKILKLILTLDSLPDEPYELLIFGTRTE